MLDPVMLGIIEETVGEAVGNLEPGYTYKGSVATVNDLPSSGNETGDLWQIREDGSEVVWDGSQWVTRSVPAITTAEIDELWP